MRSAEVGGSRLSPLLSPLRNMNRPCRSARPELSAKEAARMRQVRRWAIGGVTTAAAGVLMAAAAWACVSGPVVNLSTINAKAGQEVGITGTGFQATNQVQI